MKKTDPYARHIDDAALEHELRGRFDVRTESFEHGEARWELIMPRAADELLDEREFERDERLPYWADLWPSARALARWVLDEPALPASVIEIGCGIALPSLAARRRGVDVTATDWYEDALRFARANAARNAQPPLTTRLLDWRHIPPPPELGRFDLVLAADVLYERRNVELAESVLARLVSPGGRAIVADPGRAHLSAFRELMRERGWRIHEPAQIDEAQPYVNRTSRVQLLACSRSEARP